jgi:hypothetical protein
MKTSICLFRIYLTTLSTFVDMKILNVKMYLFVYILILRHSLFLNIEALIVDYKYF